MGVIALGLAAVWPNTAERFREWKLSRAASQGPRRLTGRLTGMAHTPRSSKRGVQNAWLTTQVTASEILAASVTPHLRGRAALLKGHSSDAVEQLRAAAVTGGAEARSDLAAALVAEAEELDAYGPALDAVVEARRAIALKPSHAPAHFNLALALLRLGFAPEARAEFETAARLEPGSKWAAEARQRANAIPQPAVAWRPTIDERVRALKDVKARRAIIHANLETARRMAEGPYLLEFSQARIEGRQEAAGAILELIRLIADVVVQNSDDRLLVDTMAVIDRAEKRGDATAIALARAHALLLAGRLAYADQDTAKAISLFNRSGPELARLGSPMRYVARYYTASALYAETRVDETLEVIESLDRDDLEGKGYLSLAALLEWERGTSMLVRGAYADALRAYDYGYTKSMAYGNHEQAAAFDGLASEALEYLGDTREAWSRRARALAALSHFPNSLARLRRSATALAGANLQISARNFERANVLLEYGVPLALAADDKVSIAHAYAQRAVTRAELRDTAGAASDRAASLRALVDVPPSEMRDRVTLDVDIANAVAKGLSSPQAAIADYTRAIDQLRARGQSVLLPRLYFERARAYEAAKDVAHVRADLRSVLDVVTTWENSARTLEQRAAIGIWSDASRRALIWLELRQNDVGAAFSYADARHTAAPAESKTQSAAPRASHIELQRVLAPRAAIIEYVTTRDGLIVFIIRPGDVRAVKLPGQSSRIAAVAEAVRTAEDESLPAASAALYDLVMAPIRHRLDGVETLAVIPDRELTGISFGTLYDRKRNRYIAEEMSVVQDLTARSVIERSHQAKPAREPSLLAIGASAFDRRRYREPAALGTVDHEAAAVARLSVGGRHLLGVNATPDAVARALGAAAVVHYAGHIVDRGPEARLLLARNGGRDSLTAREISALPLHRTRVVVLAACRGSGTTDRHAIVQDMATGFLSAGVPTVVATATDVDDAEAPETMKRLHTYLAQGADAADALRQTVKVERKSDKRVPLSVRFLVMGGSRSLVR